MKERLIGATILVVLVILIVPELLSGPKGPVVTPPPSNAAEPVRNVTVDLATSKATPVEDSTGASTAAESPASANTGASPGPAPPSGSDADAAIGGAGAAIRPAAPPTIATLRAQQPVAHDPAVTPLEKPSTAPSSPAPRLQAQSAADVLAAQPVNAAQHRWAVQLGSFASRENADKLARQAKQYDSSVYVSQAGRGAALRYRVRVGLFADRAGADRALGKLQKDGFPASLVPP